MAHEISNNKVNAATEKEFVDDKTSLPSSASHDGESGIDLAYEKKLIHKVDWRLLPILGALYSIALIDRSNMSNAAVAGMSVDLVLIEDRYSIALLIFFIPYFLFELPSNIILRKLGAAKWLGSIAVAWGAVMTGMGFIQDWRVLVVCRAILGFFEAGFFPACVYLVSCWYVRFEVQKRMAGFYLVSVLGGGFSNILAYGLMQMDGLGGQAGWRWIFIIEGIMTVLLGVLAFFVVIDFPDKIVQSGKKFLSPAEVDILKARIDRDRDDSVADELTWKKALVHLSDWKLWAFSFMFMCATTCSYAFSYFLPIILAGMGNSPEKSQLLSAPPYVVAVVTGFSCAVISDKIRMRAPAIIVQAVMCIVGLAITAYAENTNARYFGTFLGLAGANGNVPAILSYQANNIRMNSRRSVASALQVGFGALGGIVASTVFRQQDQPRYIPGLWTAMGTQILLLALAGIMTFHFKRRNKQQREGNAVLEGHPDFQYTI